MIIAFCGVPGSGKSTVAELLIQELLKSGKSCELFASDEVSKRVYDTLFDFVEEKVKGPDYLIIDATFYKKKWRDQIQEIVERNNEDLLTIYLRCDLETCLERNEQRPPDEQVPEKAVHIINSEIEKPEEADIILNTDKVEPEQIVEEILQKAKALS